MKIGDKVKILDYSDIHGEEGIISLIEHGLVLVEINCEDKIDGQFESYIWPVHLEEVEVLDEYL